MKAHLVSNANLKVGDTVGIFLCVSPTQANWISVSDIPTSIYTNAIVILQDLGDPQYSFLVGWKEGDHIPSVAVERENDPAVNSVLSRQNNPRHAQLDGFVKCFWLRANMMVLANDPIPKGIPRCTKCDQDFPYATATSATFVCSGCRLVWDRLA
jgi:hypothetical protein